MPGLGNLSLSASLSLTHCPNFKSSAEPSDLTNSQFPSPVKTLGNDFIADQRLGFPILQQGEVGNGNGIRVFRRRRGSLDRTKKALNGKSLEDHVKAWREKKIDSGVPELRCCLPFLVGTPKMVECLVCQSFVYPGEEVLCSVRGCQGVFHIKCAKEAVGVSNTKNFKCLQHACFICKQKLNWRCVRCTIAAHDKCAPWPEAVMHLKDQPGRAVCWRHPTDWRLDRKHEVSTSDMEDVFSRLPLPYVDEEFKIDFTWKDTEHKIEPPPYMHIRRNIYLVKKKRSDVVDDTGCTNCSSTSTCSEDCVCRGQCISCSKACRCSENCRNRPFRKEKKIKIVKTELCGWGVEAAESISRGEFLIEYIGEVIDDALCEQRLWDMKYRGVNNFYMCEIRKDFTIDATFKGNASRFLNHSCEPNCILEKWQVEGETRVGVFAARSIEVGEPLTYDYRFVQFGPEVKCHCGALNCQGFLGTKRKIDRVDLYWGTKRKRTSTACIAILNV
ncbi:Histone-lysine N-methyltransferase [Quillaja saponaria]|uniref:Histone-lysine N-methyltransferase n=1 Tax=Quillaja saponaria TaxID=32244 RepID=A0AAD7LCN5_QUISA|nr:Histone-lysine N-methyltransferase [Quillaja saponaria]